MRTAHTTIGVVFLLIFLATGAWMRLRFPEAFGGDDGVRMMFRSTHIYILMTSLLNLVLGKWMASPASGWRLRLQQLGSTLLLISPPLLTVAFFVEPAPHRLQRPLAHLGVIFAAIGTLLTVMCERKSSAPP